MIDLSGELIAASAITWTRADAALVLVRLVARDRRLRLGWEPGTGENWGVVSYPDRVGAMVNGRLALSFVFSGFPVSSAFGSSIVVASESYHWNGFTVDPGVFRRVFADQLGYSYETNCAQFSAADLLFDTI